MDCNGPERPRRLNRRGFSGGPAESARKSLVKCRVNYVGQTGMTGDRPCFRCAACLRTASLDCRRKRRASRRLHRPLNKRGGSRRNLSVRRGKFRSWEDWIQYGSGSVDAGPGGGGRAWWQAQTATRLPAWAGTGAKRSRRKEVH